MSFKPRDYQLDDCARLINAPRTGLFHEPGGGKTFIAAMFSQYVTQATNEGVVWAQPGGIIAKNRDDILFATNFAPEEVVIVQGSAAKRKELMATPGAKVLLVSGQGFSNEWKMFPPKFKHLVADEVHLYYTLHSEKPESRVQQFYQACRKYGAIVPMTGTIIRGRLDSAYPVCHTIAPEYYGNNRAFNQHHAWFDESGKVIGWKNHDRLKEVLNRVGIFRSFKEIYGSESKVIQVMNFEVSNAVRKVYKRYEDLGLIEMTDEFIDSGQTGTNAAIARSILAAPTAYGLKGATPKLEYLRTLIEDHLKSGERLVVFSPLMKEQEEIMGLFQEMKIVPGQINGTVSNEARQDIDKRFRENNLQFVLASPATAGIGFSWPFLNTVVFMSLDYTDDSLVQAYRRGIRGVRETPLRVLILHYPGTIEDRVLQTIDRKSRDHHLINPAIDVTNLFELSLTSRKSP